MTARNKLTPILTLVFFFCGIAFGQAGGGKKLIDEIDAAIKRGGKQGLESWMKINKNRVSTDYINSFALVGVKKRSEFLLTIALVLAKTKGDEATMAFVLYKVGQYFKLTSNHKRAANYYSIALKRYRKLNDPVGRANVYVALGEMHLIKGELARALERFDNALHLYKKNKSPVGRANVYLLKAEIHSKTGENSKALKMYDNALHLYEKNGVALGMGEVYVGKGNLFSSSGDPLKALEMYEKALPLYEKAGSFLGRGKVYLSKGNIHFNTGENSKAIEMYDLALPIFEKAGEMNGQGDIYDRKADIYFNSGHYTKAIEMCDKALHFYGKAGSPLGRGNVYLTKGMIHAMTGENSNAFEMFGKALSLFEKSGHPLGKGNVYFKMGGIYLSTGNKLKAFEMFDKALTFYEEAGHPFGMANVYQEKGNMYLFSRCNLKSNEMFDKALAVFEKAASPLGRGSILLSKGAIFTKNGDYSKAFEMYNKALAFFKKAGSPYNQGLAYFGMGANYGEMNEHSKALAMYDQAMLFFKKSLSPIGRGCVYLAEGLSYFKTGSHWKALEVYNKAQAALKNTGAIEMEAGVFHGKAMVSAKTGNKENARRLFDRGIANLEKVRSQNASSGMKKLFMEDAYQQYQETVLFMLANGYSRKGFKYAESMRARVFLDRIAEGFLKLDKGLTPGLKEKRDNLVTKLSLLSKEMHETAAEKEKKKAMELKDRYHKVESELEDVLVNIRLSNPLYASVRYPQPITVPELQKNVLKKGELLLRFVIFPKKAYALPVSRETFEVIAFDINEKEIDNTVGAFLRGLKEKNDNHIKRYGLKLYRELFKPLEPRIKKSKEIIVIPDGQLATIPFESLIIHKEKSGRPVFLLEKYRIKYIQSASLLSILRKYYRGNSQTGNFIGFGDPVYDHKRFKKSKSEQAALTGPRQPKDEIKQVLRSRYARSGGILDRLPASGEEVRAIARLFKKYAQKATVFSREQATEANAKAPAMKDFDYIHFACHGLLNDDFQSLVLSRLPQNQSTEDGYFTLNEIMNCDYRAKLIVLSACQTGSGKMERAEGVTGLTRAVMYAGTPAVVASLWNVDDQATKELMLHFYRNLLEEKMDKVEALRQAKLELLKNKKYRSPLFWSAFVMYGE